MSAICINVLLGLFAGYLTATVSESWLHRFVGHASAKSRRRWKKGTWFGRLLVKAHFGHSVVHHGKTFRTNHVTQFKSKSEQQDLDIELIENGNCDFIELRYGLITDLWGSLLYVAGPASGCLTVSIVAFGRLNPWFLGIAALPICITPLLSIGIHPYLHMSRKRVTEEAPIWIRWLLLSPYGDWARKQHFVHHRTPRFNFNLLPGGDILLRTSRKPTDQETQEMRMIGLLALQSAIKIRTTMSNRDTT